MPDKEKIIRDILGSRINLAEDGKVRLANEAEISSLLKNKLDEEIAELKASNFKDITEYADVFTVLITIAEREGISFEEIHKAMSQKSEKLGNFDMGWVLKLT